MMKSCQLHWDDMKNNEELENLLKIEAQAADFVNDAQAEADRRIQENENKNRSEFEKTLAAETEVKENIYKTEKEKIENQYQSILEEYCREISGLHINTEKFCTLLNKYIEAQ